MRTPLYQFIALAFLISAGVFGYNPSLEAEETAEKSASSANPEVTTPRGDNVPDVTSQQQQLLAEAVADEGLITLKANGKAFIALWKTENSGTPAGAVLFFHGEGQHLDWPGTVTELRENLVRFGWATLSITLPDPIAPAPPAKPSPEPRNPPETSKPTAAESSTNTAASSSLKTAPPQSEKRDVESDALARANAAMAFLNTKGQYNIVLIGHGIGAARAARFLNTLSGAKNNSGLNRKLSQSRTQAIISRPVRAMVLVNARNTIPFAPEIQGQTVISWINHKEMPVLDIYTRYHLADVFEPAARRKEAQEKQLSTYIQVNIKPPLTYNSEDENALAKRVRGFLNKYAKGVKID